MALLPLLLELRTQKLRVSVAQGCESLGHQVLEAILEAVAMLQMEEQFVVMMVRSRCDY